MDKLKKVLIVEDEIIIAESIKKSLIKLEYNVIGIVTFGEDSIIVSRDLKPDIVLMDIMLEGEMNGIEAADIILKNYEIPIIFLTSYGDKDTMEKAVLSQPYGYIIKPFDDIELSVTIEMAFYKHKMEKKLRENQKFLKLIIDNNPNLIYVLDNHDNYLLANRALGKLLNLDQNSMIGKSLSQIHKSSSGLHEYLTSLHDKTIGKSSEFSVKDSDGENKWFEIHKIDITTPDKIPCSLAVAVDITQRKKAKVDLKESYIRLKKLFSETVKGLASAAEMRDPYTAGHQRRVAALAVKIAEQLNLDQDTIDGVYLTALIHDIGKIFIPTAILSKPGQLTDIEMKLIQHHSKAGYDVLKNIDFPWPVADIILQHHEKMDGSSYPAGLKGEEILLEARIICVADVIEAMASHRPYRPSKGIDFALAEIEKNKGKFYDEDVVNACITLFKDLNFEFPELDN